MQFLIDKSTRDVKRKTSTGLVAGQLLTPLTRYANWGGVFAIDNGAFSGFRHQEFDRLLAREQPRVAGCLFVTCPDIVANHRRTLELWDRRARFIDPDAWPVAFVAQDGSENGDIPWDDMAALFVGGGDPWKDSAASADIVRTAKTLGVHVHVGRVNQIKRYEHFAALGADTCDGSGVAQYDEKLEAIVRHVSNRETQTQITFE